MWCMIPAVETRAPTEENRPENFPARLGNQSKNEGVVEPALRHQRSQQQEQRIAVAIPEKS